jgi:quercetin dioxygenase-like cupin family protein
MSGAKSEKLTLFDFDDAPMLADTDMMAMPVLTDPAVGPEPMIEWAGSTGHVVKVLYRGDGDDGMSLVWSWFGPGYTLPRHSHSADCLYYVVKGEAHLGNRVVHAGSGFFVPADAPYAYTAGPEGIEILEFRDASSFDMVISESAARFEKIVEGVRTHRDAWAEGAAALA